MPSQTFDTVGQHTYTVPPGVFEVDVECWGAEGGTGSDSAAPGEGGYAEDTIDVSPGETLPVHVGGRDGTNGGGSPGASYAGPGGGASDVRRSGGSLSDREVVGAGGGGGGGNLNDPATAGGDGGGLQGSDAGGTQGGSGGTQTSGGAGGSGENNGDGGAFGEGGDGGPSFGGGGGGGGGYYGGGGGAAEVSPGGGGGGSSLGSTTDAGVWSGDGQVVITAPPGAPQGESVDDVRETEADVSWDDVDSADEYRLYRHDAADPYANGSRIATIPDDGSASFSYTDTGLTNGRQYHYQVTAYDSGESVESTPSDEIAASTLLPSPSIDDTDPSAEEIGLLYSLADDNPDGHVDVLRSTDGSMGTEIGTVSDLSQTEFTDSSVTQGETYHYTLRRDTGDVSTFSAQIEETATFRPVDDLEIEEVETQSVDLSWESPSSWSGETEVWRDRADYDYDDPKGTQVSTVADDVLSYDDTGLPPEREFTYTIVAATDAEGDVATDPATAETLSIGARQTRLPSSGWLVEADHPSGRTVRPTLLEGTNRSPSIRDLYRATAHVPMDDRWQDDSFEQVPARAWADGDRLPVEQLDSVGRTESSGDARSTLELVGGVGLRTRVDRDVDTQPIHELVGELVAEHTDLAVNVDAPQASTTTDTFSDPDSTSEWASALTDTALSSVPLEAVDGGLQTQQSCWTIEGEDFDRNAGTGPQPGSGYSGQNVDETPGVGQAERLDGTGQWTEYDVTLGYDIAEANVGFRVIGEMEAGVSIQVTIDGVEYTTTGTGSAFGTGLWVDLNDAWDGGDLEAGDHTIRVECVDTDGSGSLDLDVLALYDSRYSYNFDTNVSEAPDGSNYLDGPEPMPVVDADLDRVPSVLSVAGVEIASTWNDTTDGQAIGVRNEAGGSFTTSSNTDAIDESFDDLGALLDVRLTLGRYGSRTTTPATGFEGQRVESLTATADLDTTPLVIQRSLDDTILAIAQQLARDANAVFGIGIDDGALSFEWTQIGQRDGGEVVDVELLDEQTDYDFPERVIVYGGHQDVREESVEADHGEPAELENARIDPNSEYVRSASGTAYDEGDDYEIDWTDGTITTLEDGEISDGAALTIDYRFQPRASQAIDDVGDDPREEVVRIPELESNRGCGLAAFRIIQEVGEPLQSATVQVPEDAGVSVVEAVSAEGLTADSYELRGIESPPAASEMTLGSRRRSDEVVDDIRSQLRSLSGQV